MGRTGRTRFTFFAFVMFLVVISPESGQGKTKLPPEDVMNKRIDLVWKSYEKGQYKKARKDLDRIMDEIESDPSHGEYYLPSMFRGFKIIDGKINDKMGVYRTFPKFSGEIIEVASGSTGGYMQVNKGKKKKYFSWDLGTVIEGNLSKGSMVTITYDKDDDRAVKIVTHKRNRLHKK